jgi:hypothetical protein
MGGQRAGGFHAEAGRYAGDEHAPATEILAGKNVICGGFRPE